MYYDYFGLTEAPFSIAPNPDYLFMTERHQEALAHLYHGVESDAGFVLLTGDVGTGKTTVCRRFLSHLPERTELAFILNPFLGGRELLYTLCQELAIEPIPEQASLRQLVDCIYRRLLKNHARGYKTVLLIDEAQHIHRKVLELIRLLTNLETNHYKLLKIILVGQPELNDCLDRPDMVQLSQRITARYHIYPLNLAETAAYIDYRLRMAGFLSEAKLFPRAVVKRIYRKTQGVPRLINVLCDRALLGVYAQHKARVDRRILARALAEIKGVRPARIGRGQFLWAAMMAVTALALLLVLIDAYRPTTTPTTTIPTITPGTDPVQLPLSASTEQVSADPPAPVPAMRQSERHRQASVWRNTQSYSHRAPAIADLFARINPGHTGQRHSCETLASVGWRCGQHSAKTWRDFRAINRPSVISVIVEGQQQYRVLVGITAVDAQLLSREGIETLPLAELGDYWTGEFTYLWQPPAGFVDYIYFDADPRLVQWLAQAFARIDRRDDLLATTTFTSVLKQRVKLFQRQHQLLEDGIAGLGTLLKINEQLGVAITAVKH